jgi:hypothetical protein
VDVVEVWHLVEAKDAVGKAYNQQPAALVKRRTHNLAVGEKGS